MIEIKNLTRMYGEKAAVENVSFQINKGEIVGLLGPNGAGKTTIMKMIAGYLMPTEGTIKIDGIDVVEHPREATEKIGFLPELPPLYLDMEVSDYLRFMSEIKGIAKEDRESRIDEMLEVAQIVHVKDRVIRNLSKGYRQRVGLAGALMGMPEILILDEPTVGLDPRQIADFRSLIIELGKSHTIIFSSHILSEIDMVCERVVILDEGRVVAVDSMEKLESGSHHGALVLHVAGEREEGMAALQRACGKKQVSHVPETPSNVGCWFEVADADTELRKKIFYALAEAGLPLLEMRERQLTLEQVFLNLTTGVKGVSGKQSSGGEQK